jgi:hypothetical protein
MVQLYNTMNHWSTRGNLSPKRLSRSPIYSRLVRTPYVSKTKKKKNKLRGLSPRAKYTDRAKAACRRS